MILSSRAIVSKYIGTERDEAWDDPSSREDYDAVRLREGGKSSRCPILDTKTTLEWRGTRRNRFPWRISFFKGPDLFSLCNTGAGERKTESLLF